MGANVESCALCRSAFHDIKSIVQCTACSNYYHNKCAEVDLRNFYTKKSTWKCKQCGGDPAEYESTAASKCSKQNVVENEKQYGYQYSFGDVMSMIYTLTNVMKEIKIKIDEVLVENKKLHDEIDVLRCNKTNRKTTTKDQGMADGKLTEVTSSEDNDSTKNEEFHPSVCFQKGVSNLGEEGSDGFQEIARKKKKRWGYVEGTRKSDHTLLRAVVRKKFLYAGNFDPRTTTDEVLGYLQKNFPQEHFTVEKLPKRETAKSVAFKIGSSSILFPSLMSGDFWPQGIRVKKFQFLNKGETALTAA